MRLYDAIEVKKNGDSEDRAYAGVNVVRDSFGNVTRIVWCRKAMRETGFCM